MQATATAAIRTSLVEQKRIQWAREREEMSRLTGNCNPSRNKDAVRSTIRTYPNGHRTSLSEMNGKRHYQQHPKYASTISLRSLGSDAGNSCLGYNNGHDLTTSASLINLQDYQELERVSRQRSPSLPPIVHARDEYRYQTQEANAPHGRQSRHRCTTRNSRSRRKSDNATDLDLPEGETSGYASDNLDANAIQRHHQQHKQQAVTLLPCHVNCRNPDSAMGERTWQNPYCYEDENSLPSTRKLASLKAGEFNRQRWGSVWGQETSKDPPPPSWLERGLSRLDHSSQVLVINHDSASSPESSTTGSLSSDTNKRYLRGQNVPIDADILQERELRRQKALELQSAIKQQLAEREEKRIEERERKAREERAEEERIKREMDIEKQRLEEEQRRQREREAAKQKKNKAMQDMLEAAERQSKEDRQQRRHRTSDEQQHASEIVKSDDNRNAVAVDKETKQASNRHESMDTRENKSDPAEVVRLPVSQEVAIVLSARIEDTGLLSKSPLKLVNLVVSPTSPRASSNGQRSDLASSLNALLAGGFGSPIVLRTASPKMNANRLLTPSKYRLPAGVDCGTQTDCEGELTDSAEKLHESTKTKETKERKEAINQSRQDVEKSTNTDMEQTSKPLGRGKQQQTRQSLESRPRWNANRPGTRYRTQSEKDPHYQRRMRLRRRQLDTSDEGSSDFRRSPSPGRRKYGITKAKSRNSIRRVSKPDNYDADASMDSLNSLVPLHTDKNGRISIERPDELLRRNNNVWHGENILTHLNSLRNSLIMKKKEWDLQECPITPLNDLY